MRSVLLSLLFFAFPLNVFAINKCESNGGVAYSEMPCTNGKSQQLREPAPPDNATAAKALLTQQALTLKHLEKERLKREEREEKIQQQASRHAEKMQKKCAGLALKKKWAEEDANKASRKSAAKTKRKSLRAQEKYALECKN